MFMGADFYLYETKSDEKAELVEIKRVLYLSNSQADIVYNYFIRNYNADISYHNNIYYECYFNIIYELFNTLKLVLSKKGVERDLYAMFYFPPRIRNGNYCSGSDMFSKSYYSDLEMILNGFRRVVYSLLDDELYEPMDYNFMSLNCEREFLYHFEI